MSENLEIYDTMEKTKRYKAKTRNVFQSTEDFVLGAGELAVATGVTLGVAGAVSHIL